jgi:hypothetical protein
MSNKPPAISEEVVRASVARAQEHVLAEFPDAKFQLERAEDPAIWYFSIYAGKGRLMLPMEAVQELNTMWVQHQVSVITTVYPSNLYQEAP